MGQMGGESTVPRANGSACPWCGFPLANPNARLCLRCGRPLQLPHAEVSPLPIIGQDDAPTVADVDTQRLNPQGSPLGPRVGRPKTATQARPFIVAAVVAAVLLVAAIGTTGALYFGNQIAPSSPSSNGPSGVAAKQATATSTAVPTATVVPTATPQPTATQPAPTATPKPTLRTLFQDPLTANVNGWYTNDHDVTMTATGYHIRDAFICYAPVKVPPDVNITVQATQMPSAVGVYGVVFRSKDENHGYLFWVSIDGQWGVLNLHGGTLVNRTHNFAIRRGYGAYNTLQVQASGSQFSFYANGTRLGSVNDGTYASGGAGFYVESQNELAIFKNFKLTQWT